MMFSVFPTLAVATVAVGLGLGSTTNAYEQSSANSYASRSFLKNAAEVATKNNQQEHRSLSVPDISGFNLLFQSCKTLEDYNEHTERSSYRQFVIYRLCESPIDYYDSQFSCSAEFGEYAVKLQDYLSEVVPIKQMVQDKDCEDCREFCTRNNPQNVVQAYAEMCNDCLNDCSNIDNMEANGYLDATEFSKCQMIYDPPDDDTGPFYAGPMCSEGVDGFSTIRIGVFDDPQCTIPDVTKQVEDYVADENGYSMKLSYALLRNIYEDDQGISCNKEICDSLYQESDRCETRHKFPPILYSDVTSRSKTEEALECDFIGTLQQGGEFSTTTNSGKNLWLGLVVGGAIVASLAIGGYARNRSRRNQKEQPAGSGGMESRGHYELISIDGSDEDSEK